MGPSALVAIPRSNRLSSEASNTSSLGVFTSVGWVPCHYRRSVVVFLPSVTSPLPTHRRSRCSRSSDASSRRLSAVVRRVRFLRTSCSRWQRRLRLDLLVDIGCHVRFSRSGPGGCNTAAAAYSESLVQILATEGINLPLDVAQRGIESYVVHMDVDSVRIASPGGERRIAALYRGNGPRTGEATPWESFDGFLQKIAVSDGARVRSLVSGIEWRDGLPNLLEAGGAASPYELVCIASGVNSNFVGLLAQAGVEMGSLETMRTYICEFRSDPETIQRVLGDSMHVFLLDIPRLEFAALIPKGEFVTMCLLGEDIDEKLVHEFLHSPEVMRCFPVDSTPCVCTCSPLINVRGPKEPFADRVVLVGDSGVTRLYKDGIGAALRTAKAAAESAVFQGIAAEDFRRHYALTCEAIAADNAIGKFMFTVTRAFKYARFSRRAIARA